MAISWHPVRDSLNAFISTAADSISRAVGTRVLLDLNAAGTVYDTYFLPRAPEFDAADAANVAARATAYSTVIIPKCQRLDEVARWAEGIELASHPGVYLATLKGGDFDGQPHPLAPASVATFDSDLSFVPASVTLSSCLRLTAKLGITDNRLVAVVSGSGTSSFDLEVRLGNASTLWTNVEIGGEVKLGEGFAPLSKVEWLARTRPSNGTTSFAGGIGGSVAYATLRIGRAACLPALSKAQKAILDSYVTNSGGLGWGPSSTGRESYPQIDRRNYRDSYATIERSLQECVDRGNALLSM